MPKSFQIVFLVILLAAAAPPMINGTNTRLTDESSPDVLQIKCGGCPCDNPYCYTTTPPPPSPSPPPPPSPPKIPVTPTPGLNCPPASPTSGGGSRGASPGYMYITGPPGDLYPVNPYFSGSHRSLWASPPLVAVFGLLGILIAY